MTDRIRFVLALHNHQPIGNFDHVFEAAYQDSYLPFLDVFEEYSSLRIALHTSGSLMEWLDRAHPEYVDRLAQLVAADRIEIIGGAFFEPILAMIPPRDRVGQIQLYSSWLEERLGATIRGMWVPERVWEQSLTSDIVDAGIGYMMLDDFHFKNAGLMQDELHGYYASEDNGRVLRIFPGSERLRYLIPFQSPQQTIDYLGEINAHHPGSVMVFADDGEKFGTWPDTKQHVYDNGWLRQFFDLLVANESWINVTTPSEAIENTPPRGKVYLPDGSYREMTEWVLPPEKQNQLHDLVHDMEHDQRWLQISPFIRGGFWRNFKVRYPESDEMYSRMMQVSSRLAEVASRNDVDEQLLEEARQELYRGQCNCSYWHGAFGGIYLPHLRNAVYRHLILADGLIDQAIGRRGQWIEATPADYNFDLRQEVQLANDRLAMLFAPAAGGSVYELDVRGIAHNLLATLSRRVEAYHRKVLAGPPQGGDGVASIHDRVVFKQADLDKRIQYDSYLRKSLIDHFYGLHTSVEDVATGRAGEVGDFVGGIYEAKVRRNPDRIQVQLHRQGNAEGVPLTITKGVTLSAGSSTLEIAYLIEGLPANRQFHFAVEMNFAGLPSGADDRYYRNAQQQRIGDLGSKLEVDHTDSLGVTDEWLGIDLNFSFAQPSRVWTFPIETVSQSEGGFELVHQSLVTMPHWIIQGDEQGRWSTSMQLDIDTGRAEERDNAAREVAEAEMSNV